MVFEGFIFSKLWYDQYSYYSSIDKFKLFIQIVLLYIFTCPVNIHCHYIWSDVFTY